MCILFIAHQAHPRFPLIVAGNRDEFYERPSESAHFWRDEPEVLAGRDLEQGGTWFGVNQQGYWAGLTNYRDPQAFVVSKKTRGQIVADFLKMSGPIKNFLYQLADQKALFNGYSLICGNTREVWYYSNRTNYPRQLKPGIYGLCNHLLNTPWPKLQRGKELFSAAIRSDNNDSVRSALEEVLQDQWTPPEQQLPNTGVTKEWEKVLAPIFVKSDTYGTRAMTLWLVEDNRRAWLQEKSLQIGRKLENPTWKKVSYSFTII